MQSVPPLAVRGVVWCEGLSVLRTCFAWQDGVHCASIVFTGIWLHVRTGESPQIQLLLPLSLDWANTLGWFQLFHFCVFTLSGSTAASGVRLGVPLGCVTVRISCTISSSSGVFQLNVVQCAWPCRPCLVLCAFLARSGVFFLHNALCCVLLVCFRLILSPHVFSQAGICTLPSSSTATSSTARPYVVGMQMAGCVCIARLSCTYPQVKACCLE